MPRPVEGGRQVVGLAVAEQVEQVPEDPEDGVGRLARRPRHQRDGVEDLVDQGIGFQDVEGGPWRHRGNRSGRAGKDQMSGYRPEGGREPREVRTGLIVGYRPHASVSMSRPRPGAREEVAPGASSVGNESAGRSSGAGSRVVPSCPACFRLTGSERGYKINSISTLDPITGSAPALGDDSRARPDVSRPVCHSINKPADRMRSPLAV